MIKDFFESLSYRKCNENDLSDVTWALLNASPMFRDAFLKFFFHDIMISPEIEIVREEARGDSRPDFVIHNGNELYLIENKINDKNQHFGQYDKVFNVTPEKFGYIANYVIHQPKQGECYQIRTWEDLFNKLENVYADNEEEQLLIEGYRIYLKNTCNIIDFRKSMNIEGIFSLYQLIEVLCKLCKRETKNFTLNIYNFDRTYTNRYATHSTTGVNFEVKFNNVRMHAYGWVGVYFSEETPLICMGFWDAKNWGYPICRMLDNNSDIKEGKLCSSPYYEDDAFWFDFIDGKDTYEEQFNKLSLEQQTDQLRDFMDEVLNLIYMLRKGS